ncbi:hypothetical protein [Nonomuraea sediminis]|uniref:hypothetical protein n=1 Tax=Nonomuraea sediminis TaxID=2835864 RepID=UPI001BDC936A|nr:hypothetical protein [Nonomuraea sediminis]
MTENHHGSHRHLLLAHDAPESDDPIDAIIVPTVRPAVYLRHAISQARKLGCPLIALASGRYYQQGFHDLRKACEPDTEVHALIVGDPANLALPALRTSTVPPPYLRRGTDTAAKRNLGLVLARLLGWRRVIFLDDDITVPAPGDLRKAAGLLRTYSAVGLSVGGFPDNSVACHAFRAVGGHQETFVGGGALAIDAGHISFFPDIYNEDWFYLLEDDGLRQLAVTGAVKQYPYDPFRTVERAKSEEFGDVLAEGVFWLLDEGRSPLEADLEHWRKFLHRRAMFLRDILDGIPGCAADRGERERMAAALRAALRRHELITPELCVRYLHAWRADRRTWHDFVARLRPAPSVEAAMERLTLKGRPKLPALHLAGRTNF